ncbi:MAG: 50S ribosomal protein L3 [Bdellovibrionaceae bacterium]|nr:50S ribosomal protein L3 [Pseudobdellovibrionaceae bacterium]
MSEEQVNTEEQAPEVKAEDTGLKLSGVFAYKLGMSTVYDADAVAIPVTVLKYEPWFVSQIKTVEKDGYSAIQIASGIKKAKNTLKSEKGHFSKAGFENGAKFVREIRQDIPEGVELGQKVAIDSVAAGDKVQLTSKSKGRGFAGTMKRHDFGGGPASHGSGFKRRPGSIGNRTWPGRVIKGKRMAGHYGDENITVKNVNIVDVIPEENVILVKGPVPGGRNNLVKLMKV